MTEDELGTVLDGHLCDVLAQSNEMVTKWVALVEVIDGDGKRWLHTLTSQDAAVWDTLGLLTHALTTEKASLATEIAS